MIPIRLHITMQTKDGFFETRLNLPDYLPHQPEGNNCWDAARDIAIAALDTGIDPDSAVYKFYGARNASVPDCDYEERAVLDLDVDYEKITDAIATLVSTANTVENLIASKPYVDDDAESKEYLDRHIANVTSWRDDYLKDLKKCLHFLDDFRTIMPETETEKGTE